MQTKLIKSANKRKKIQNQIINKSEDIVDSPNIFLTPNYAIGEANLLTNTITLTPGADNYTSYKNYLQPHEIAVHGLTDAQNIIAPPLKQIEPFSKYPGDEVVKHYLRNIPENSFISTFNPDYNNGYKRIWNILTGQWLKKGEN